MSKKTNPTNEASDQNNLAILAHLSPFALLIVPLGNIWAPLLFWLINRGKNQNVARHALAALNFQLTLSGVAILYLIAMSWAMSMDIENSLFFHGHLLLMVIGSLYIVYAIVNMVIAAIQANRHEIYEYPLTIKFFRN